MSKQRTHQAQSSWQPHQTTPQHRKPQNLAPLAEPNQPAVMLKPQTESPLERSIRVKQAHSTVPKLASTAVQPKLTIGQPNDKYEQEADNTARRVVQEINSPGQALQQKIQTQMQAPIVSMPLAQGADASTGGVASAAFESQLKRARTGGAVLEPGLQRSMGSAMGADFSQVKVHTDSTANALSQSIQAKAFTTGPDIFFKRGEYNPGSRSGQELIAHELTHTVQQGAAVQRQVDGMIQRQITDSKGKTFALDEAVSWFLKQLTAQGILVAKADVKQFVVNANYATHGVYTLADVLADLRKQFGGSQSTATGQNQSSADEQTATESTAPSNDVSESAASASQQSEQNNKNTSQSDNASANPTQEQATEANEQEPTVKAATTLMGLYPKQAIPNAVALVKKLYDSSLYNARNYPYDFFDSTVKRYIKEGGEVTKSKGHTEDFLTEKFDDLLDELEESLDELKDQTMQDLGDEFVKPPTERRSETEIIEPLRKKVHQCVCQLASKLKEIGVPEDYMTFDKSSTPEIFKDNLEFENIEAIPVDEQESTEIPVDDMDVFLKGMRQVAGKGACNLAASFSAMIMSESSSLKQQLKNCFLGEGADGTLSYRFYGQNNALAPHQGQGTTQNNNDFIDRVLQFSKTIYTVQKSYITKLDLLPFTTPWIYYMAQAYYEYAKDVWQYNDPQSHTTDVSLSIQESEDSQPEQISYNLVMNSVGTAVSFQGNDELKAQSLEKIPEDKDCKGKMFKLNTNRHARMLVCLAKENKTIEKRLYNNEATGSSPYTVEADKTVKQLVKIHGTANVIMYDIPSNLESELDQ